MTQISRHPVSEKVEKRIFEVFEKAISSLTETSDIENFLHEFLSPVEKIMLSKRLSIAILLEKGFSYEGIKDILHVTPQTIAKVNLQRQYAGVGYQKVIQKILTEESAVQFWEKIENVLSNIPHSKGASIKKQKETLHLRKSF